MVRNGDFSDGLADWTLSFAGSASARFTFEDGRTRVNITDAGLERDDIRLIHTGMKLVEGET